MSWRHPESMNARKIRQAQNMLPAEVVDLRALNFGFIDTKRLKGFQELPGRAYIEFLVARFDAEKESASSGQSEPRYVEKWVIRRWQTVHCQHPKGSCESSAENRQLKGDGNECGPAIEGLAIHVQRKAHHVRI